MQDLRCPEHPQYELSENALCPSCRRTRAETALLVDLTSVATAKATQRANASTANIDRVLKGLAPSLPPVGVR